VQQTKNSLNISSFENSEIALGLLGIAHWILIDAHQYIVRPFDVIKDYIAHSGIMDQNQSHLSLSISLSTKMNNTQNNQSKQIMMEKTKSSTQLCRYFFTKNHCKYGDECTYLHNIPDGMSEEEALKQITCPQTLIKEGYKGSELFEKIATKSIGIKSQARTNRCSKCWHDQRTHCICAHIQPIQVHRPIKALVLMHYKEYLSAGNDAKLLLSMMPNDLKELYIFGKEGDWQKLEEECSIDPKHTILLWPSEDAWTVDEWMDHLPLDSPWNKKQTDKQPHVNDLPTLRVIVLDGVYSHARLMFRTMKRRFPPDRMPPHVALHPTTVSVYHRAQKNYAQASASTVKKSNDPNRLHICTVEAFALLMKELGEDYDITQSLVKAVQVNNMALLHDVNVRP
jgi:DTW domain-containing protein YfiP